MTAAAYNHPITIVPGDIDFMGHVNNSRYLAWVQDAVLSHWRKLAPADAAASRLWVALTHEITYRKPAFLDDIINARTVLQHVKGTRAFYDTVIERGDEKLAEIKSCWCCVDAITLRPARIGEEVRRFFFPPDN